MNFKKWTIITNTKTHTQPKSENNRIYRLFVQCCWFWFTDFVCNSNRKIVCDWRSFVVDGSLLLLLLLFILLLSLLFFHHIGLIWCWLLLRVLWTVEFDAIQVFGQSRIHNLPRAKQSKRKHSTWKLKRLSNVYSSCENYRSFGFDYYYLMGVYAFIFIQRYLNVCVSSMIRNMKMVNVWK